MRCRFACKRIRPQHPWLSGPRPGSTLVPTDDEQPLGVDEVGWTIPERIRVNARAGARSSRHRSRIERRLRPPPLAGTSTAQAGRAPDGIRRRRSPEREDHKSSAMAWRERSEGSRDLGPDNGVHLNSGRLTAAPRAMARRSLSARAPPAATGRSACAPATPRVRPQAASFEGEIRCDHPRSDPE
jgi:hypothetical protein